jgi:hypothetical protein
VVVPAVKKMGRFNNKNIKSLELIVALIALPSAVSICPFLGRDAGAHEKMPHQHPRIPTKVEEFRKAVAELDFDAVKEDLEKMFVTSQESWPADYGVQIKIIYEEVGIFLSFILLLFLFHKFYFTPHF